MSRIGRLAPLGSMRIFPFAFVLLLASFLGACAPPAQEPASEPPPPRDGGSGCQQLYDRVVIAHRRLGDINAKSSEATSSKYLAMGDVMERLDVTLAEMKPGRDDVKLLVEEYRNAARAMAVASREAADLLAKAEDAKAKLGAENGPRSLPKIVERLVTRCRQTHDDDCRRVANPLRELGVGTPSAERIEAARTELGNVRSSDPELRGSVDALRETLAEMAGLVRTASELDKRGRARADDFARAAHGFSGLQNQANAACSRELQTTENL